MNAFTANRIAVDAQIRLHSKEGMIAQLNEQIEAAAKNAVFQLQTENMPSADASRLKRHFKEQGFFVQKFSKYDMNAPETMSYLMIHWSL